MVERVPGRHRIPIAADKGYDTRDLVAEWCAMQVTPDIAQHSTTGRGAIDARTSTASGLQDHSQRRKLVEHGFTR